MKKTFLIVITVFLLTSVFAQRMEYRLSFNSGLFSFVGKSSASSSFINSYTLNGPMPSKSYTNNPYGSKKGLCYGISANVMRVSGIRIIYGVDLGYEMLRSKIAINGVYDNNSFPLATMAQASGKSNINFSFINIHPFAGYRFVLKPVHIDITAGFDVARCLSAKEVGSADASNGLAYKTSVDRETIKSDFRPRIQLAAGFKQFGIYTGYSFGQVNYMKGYVGGTNEAYSRVFRFGVTYRLV